MHAVADVADVAAVHAVAAVRVCARCVKSDRVRPRRLHGTRHDPMLRHDLVLRERFMGGARLQTRSRGCEERSNNKITWVLSCEGLHYS